MSQNDSAQLVQVLTPPPIFADFNTDPDGMRTLTVNLSSVFGIVFRTRSRFDVLKDLRYKIKLDPV